MDEVFTLLREDHDRILSMFREALTNHRRMPMRPHFDRIRIALDDHAHIEETVFYPTCQKHIELKRMVLEFTDAHNAIKELLPDTTRSEENDDYLANRLRALKTRLEDHIREEEERMFPLAEKVLRRWELDRMRQELESAYRRLGTWQHGGAHVAPSSVSIPEK